MYCTCRMMLFLFLKIITKKQFELNDQTAKELTEMAQQGIKLLTSWTTAVMELVRGERGREGGREGGRPSVPSDCASFSLICVVFMEVAPPN